MTEEAGLAGLKRALIAVFVLDGLLVALGLLFYLGVVRPQTRALEQARDQAVTVNVAMTARVHAIESRLALAGGDARAAQRAATDLLDALTDLEHRIPSSEGRREARDLKERAMLAQNEIETDPRKAWREFDLIDARLAALAQAIAR